MKNLHKRCPVYDSDNLQKSPSDSAIRASRRHIFLLIQLRAIMLGGKAVIQKNTEKRRHLVIYILIIRLWESEQEIDQLFCDRSLYHRSKTPVCLFFPAKPQSHLNFFLFFLPAVPPERRFPPSDSQTYPDPLSHGIFPSTTPYSCLPRRLWLADSPGNR